MLTGLKQVDCIIVELLQANFACKIITFPLSSPSFFLSFIILLYLFNQLQGLKVNLTFCLPGHLLLIKIILELLCQNEIILMKLFLLFFISIEFRLLLDLV